MLAIVPKGPMLKEEYIQRSIQAGAYVALERSPAPKEVEWEFWAYGREGPMHWARYEDEGNTPTRWWVGHRYPWGYLRNVSWPEVAAMLTD